MELQTFTFFLLAFVVLTDGAPRDMDDSIDKTKPEHAKAADLARARTRRQTPELFYPADGPSSQYPKLLAMEWYTDQYGDEWTMSSCEFVGTQVVENGENFLVIAVMEKLGEPESDKHVLFQIYSPVTPAEPIITVNSIGGNGGSF